jgi:transcriptional antiterminator NusG
MNGTQEEMSSSEFAPQEPHPGEPEDSASHEPEDSGAEPAVSDEAGAQEEEAPSPAEEAFEARVEEAASEADLVDAATESVLEETVEEAAQTAETDEEFEETVTEAVREAELIEAANEEEVLAEAEAIAEKAADAPSEDEQVVETTVKDPFKGPGEWYVVHTYAGYENKVKANLESRIHTMQMENKIFEVVIPMEDVMEIKGGKKQIVQRKVFPGYLLVKMIYDNDSWYVVRNTPGVTGFVAAGTGSKPTPLSRREVEKILAVKKEVVKPTFRLGFEEGDVVRIITGPFADFNGTISEINVDQSKLKVLVNIFDRETPVELGFDQVAKV